MVANGNGNGWRQLFAVLLVVMVPSITGAVWVGSRLARLETQVQNLKESVDAGTDDRFRGADWLREKQWIQGELEHLEDRIERLER